jgi:predicted aconitase with swiveling domain
VACEARRSGGRISAGENVTDLADTPPETLIPGHPGTGKSLILTAPISFWGGVDPKTGRIADVRHPQHGSSIAGKVLFLPGTIGSSSASAVLLELVRNGNAPAALVLHEPDAILLLGLIVAKEMGWETPMAVRLDRKHFRDFAGRCVRVPASGLVSCVLRGSPSQVH